MKKIILLSVTAFVFSILLFSCANNKDNTGQGNTDNDSISSNKKSHPENELAENEFQLTKANLPSPLVIIDEFSKAGLAVDFKLLNPSENISKYQSSLQQAFNYGIYSIDLGYLVVNDRSTDILDYYLTTSKLAQSLGIGNTFDSFAKRFEKNKGIKDSLARISDEAFDATDNYLRNNERLETASEALAGSWLEGQYLTVNLLKGSERTDATEPLYERVWEQRVHLDRICTLLSEFKNNSELIKINSELQDLLMIYKELHSSKDINKDILNKLSQNLDKVRNSII